ncbi:ParB/RepB/Spo0J family partition protein [Rickettsiella grylli]|uniref:ParB-like N-terminal domain-containing protein n=1 Tax=Rickettsiella grylli TaxID=59196 RepID=A8PKB1_9COXI|nr:ParB/RepB/Spo0J family partition protein [Rickettsiella grylli]EDP46957.1 hypothetical protein RICGR_0288 [Rickettsiella grylli]
MSEVPATKTIRLGIQATRLLAENKWGFFSRNEGAETTLTHLSRTELEVTHPRTMGRKAFARLVKNIKENGISEAVKYIEYNGKNYVVDGNHRLVAARTLDLNEIPVEKVELPYLGYKSIDDFDFYNPGF